MGYVRFSIDPLVCTEQDQTYTELEAAEKGYYCNQVSGNSYGYASTNGPFLTLNITSQWPTSYRTVTGNVQSRYSKQDVGYGSWVTDCSSGAQYVIDPANGCVQWLDVTCGSSPNSTIIVWLEGLGPGGFPPSSPGGGSEDHPCIGDDGVAIDCSSPLATDSSN